MDSAVLIKGMFYVQLKEVNIIVINAYSYKRPYRLQSTFMQQSHLISISRVLSIFDTVDVMD